MKIITPQVLGPRVLTKSRDYRGSFVWPLNSAEIDGLQRASFSMSGLIPREGGIQDLSSLLASSHGCVNMLMFNGRASGIKKAPHRAFYLHQIFDRAPNLRRISDWFQRTASLTFLFPISDDAIDMLLVGNNLEVPIGEISVAIVSSEGLHGDFVPGEG